jgi:hypothetical protein
MNLSLLGRALAVLALIILAEVVNGTVRQLAITPLVGDFTARQIATGTGCTFILLIAWATSPWLAATTRRDQWCVGVLWLVLMLAFEVSAGRLVAGVQWERLAADYNLAHGGLLGLGMLWLLCAPRLAVLIREKWL